ncbi:MAG: hypothetical protein A3G52_03140 [Candidatus Taylorbacteria bacterium RIFCSPLOWO2_12_FULL_43_20]|uniref:Glycosyltransferase RgtA/B/C/D-like domain-containing protein n=1 Tax=Candidatus Taylorbacteria bacterium RIFCSPLOWO2_12_FULL_43_20 TaxID=1802332 RepID=A0A1G2P360_9BACT|nr:MAG: hypothetical protein A2825_03705 [Candidatus Taylorbacteria bacterium RIFCSPHIGHO2_01_FULL_43_120]OHA22053.1 MAG: hypothetical protein A3B98_04090 [Candidatus Taylorbacteria bacterium RIFCSPHIGHO2_02_FULL_43_55]OHA30368.1 MAG: hypothetical protein A3E92_00685 [Candidatus Taylorbacteria bacterium RIFCSPHIGHO2_12_FULL_42_34]OHA31026.1 MAG: hypothetical protein A3B09_04035 [Candidatus Taylorbacteria bacterium RIFCSPLOWO2_01_FULL_43_83]OHA39738.1 MAG: hypothetical protein A3H58_04765 [Candi
MRLIQLRRYDTKKIFIAVLAVSFILRVAYIFLPSPIWWDESIYIGMAKWIFSGHEFGYFEPFRPLVWPLVNGIIWLLGLNNLFWGKVLQVVFSMACIGLIYLIGERMRKGAGLLSTTLLAFTPVFFLFTNVSLTGIPSMFFILLSVYLLMRGRPFFAGLAGGVSFLTRYPHALYLVSVMIFFAVMTAIGRQHREQIKEAAVFGAGAGILILPFFILNFYLYGNIFYPLTAGASLVSSDPVLASQYFYYIRHLVFQNPFILFAVTTVATLFFRPVRKNLVEKRYHLLAIFAALVYISYFTWTAHKEVRYIIAFLPFFILISSTGILELNFKNKFLVPFLTVGIFILLAANIFIIAGTRPLEREREQFYGYFSDKKGARVITSTPMIMSVSDVKLIGVFDTWSNTLSFYSREKENLDYAALDTCGLACENGNCEAKTNLLSELNKETLLVHKGEVGNCELFIYKIP